MDEDFVLESLDAIESTKIVSLDKPLHDPLKSNNDSQSLIDSLGFDADQDAFYQTELISDALDQLSERKK